MRLGACAGGQPDERPPVGIGLYMMVEVGQVSFKMTAIPLIAPGPPSPILVVRI